MAWLKRGSWRPVLALIGFGVAGAMAACGRGGTSTETTTGAKATAQVPPGTAATTPPAAATARPGQPAARPNVQATDYEELKGLLPEVAGWTKSDVAGEEVSMPETHSRATARYSRNDSHIELDITDTGLSQLLLGPLSVFLASGYTERSDDGFKRALRISGQPGLEDWNGTAGRGEVTALVGSRFVVKAIGHDVSSIDAVRSVVEAIDFPKLAAIK